MSIAVFVHEISHQLGDFSIIVNKRRTLTFALLSQVITGSGAFAGGYLVLNGLGPYINMELASAVVAGGFVFQGIHQILAEVKSNSNLKGRGTISAFFEVLVEMAVFGFGFVLIEIL